MKYHIAVLLTCHNRRAKTLECLNALFDSEIPENFNLDIFLVDDGSTDGTSEAIGTCFPNVNLVQGSGDLFWNQGMRLAWNTAIKVRDFDFYLWLNDDTIIDREGLLKLFEDYFQAKKKEDKEILITAACRKSSNLDEYSYGGRNDNGSVIPNEKLQKCRYINGNLVLIPRVIYKQIGILSNDYTHALGDNDYGLRAIKNGFSCYTTKKFLATCPPNPGIPGWCNPKKSLGERWKLLHSPRGLNIKEYNQYRKKFWGTSWLKFALKAYLKTIIPKTYGKISRG